MSVRNANIVSDGKASELGFLSFEFLLRQAAKPSGELFSAFARRIIRARIMPPNPFPRTADEPFEHYLLLE